MSSSNTLENAAGNPRDPNLDLTREELDEIVQDLHLTDSSAAPPPELNFEADFRNFDHLITNNFPAALTQLPPPVQVSAVQGPSEEVIEMMRAREQAEQGLATHTEPVQSTSTGGVVAGAGVEAEVQEETGRAAEPQQRQEPPQTVDTSVDVAVGNTPQLWIAAPETGFTLVKQYVNSLPVRTNFTHPEEAVEGQGFVVEQVLAMAVKRARSRYMVRLFVSWQGWEDSHNSWVPISNVSADILPSRRAWMAAEASNFLQAQEAANQPEEEEEEEEEQEGPDSTAAKRPGEALSGSSRRRRR